jgi:hypothetical protein
MSSWVSRVVVVGPSSMIVAAAVVVVVAVFVLLLLVLLRLLLSLISVFVDLNRSRAIVVLPAFFCDTNGKPCKSVSHDDDDRDAINIKEGILMTVRRFIVVVAS